MGSLTSKVLYRLFTEDVFQSPEEDYGVSDTVIIILPSQRQNLFQSPEEDYGVSDIIIESRRFL